MMSRGHYRKESVNTDRIIEWINSHRKCFRPPGCEHDYVPHQTRQDRACTVGIVNEHRFAFYYWAQYAVDKRKPQHAVLVSLDYHKDVGVTSDVVPKDLDYLNLERDIELGLFTWLRLPSNNDGQIRPALYLDFFSDAYILISKDMDAKEFKRCYPTVKQNGKNSNAHTIRYYQDVKCLLQDLSPKCPVFLDIDLDYFTFENPEPDSKRGSEMLRPDALIRSTLSINGNLMKSIIDRLVGMTIALEPGYCGGLVNSLHILDILNNEFFNGSLCTDSCQWKEP